MSDTRFMEKLFGGVKVEWKPLGEKSAKLIMVKIGKNWEQVISLFIISG